MWSCLFRSLAFVLIVALSHTADADIVEVELRFEADTLEQGGLVMFHAAAPEPYSTVMSFEAGETGSDIASRFLARLSKHAPKLDARAVSESVLSIQHDDRFSLGITSTGAMLKIRACTPGNEDRIGADLMRAHAAYDAKNYAAAYEVYVRVQNTCAMTGKSFVRKGQIEYYGAGIQKNPAAAVASYERAVRLSSKFAILRTGQLLFDEDTYTSNDALARVYLEKAASEAYDDARWRLAGLWEVGRGGEKDLERALNYLMACAESKRPSDVRTMCRRAAGAYFTIGKHGVVDKDRAKSLLRLASEDGDAQAQSLLGLMFYESGQFAEAFVQLKRAAEAGDARAQHNLGYMYQRGTGIEQDMEAAIDWYKKSAAQGFADAKKKLKRFGR